MAAELAWDRHRIKAEIERRGGTLTGIARENGLYASACRHGIAGGSFDGAKAISRFLQIPVSTLFPNLYKSQLAREDRSRKTDRAASQKRARPAAVARAS